jgi:HAD superfamily hydrolase (TIGR01459 family)
MPVPLIESAGDLLARYEVLFCDVWGVVHDGVRAYPGANDALPRFRAGGGRVVLVSNAPLPSERVAALLDEKGVAREAWDAIVCSGDLALQHCAREGIGRVHHVGPPRDLPLFAGGALERAALDDAEALLVTGLVDDVNETAEDYRPMLERALARGLALVCANPDLVVEVGGKSYLCAGAIAALYETMGGPVVWAGKPRPMAYDAAFAAAERLAGRPVPRGRVLAVGDALRTDLAGAAAAGVDALFIAGGIHREAVTVDGRVDAARLDALLAAPEAATTVAAAAGLMW